LESFSVFSKKYFSIERLRVFPNRRIRGMRATCPPFSTNSWTRRLLSTYAYPPSMTFLKSLSPIGNGFFIEIPVLKSILQNLGLCNWLFWPHFQIRLLKTNILVIDLFKQVSYNLCHLTRGKLY